METTSSTLVADLRVRCRAGEDWACQQLEFQKPIGEPQRFAEGGYVADQEMARDPQEQDVDSLLSPEEEEVLFKSLKENPALIGIFKKFLQVPKTEEMPTQPNPDVKYNLEEGDFDRLEGTDRVDSKRFSDGGEVEGPGSGTSDSIDAKLSDGEFVFTAKAVKQIGLGKLQSMMEKAEQEFEAGSQGTPTDQQMKTLLNGRDNVKPPA
jgi:hypothetical protein